MDPGGSAHLRSSDDPPDGGCRCGAGSRCWCVLLRCNVNICCCCCCSFGVVVVPPAAAAIRRDPVSLNHVSSCLACGISYAILLAECAFDARCLSTTCVSDAAVVEDGGAGGSGDSLSPPATDVGAADTDVGSLPPPSTSPPQDLASRCAFIRSLPTFSDVRTGCLCPAFLYSRCCFCSCLHCLGWQYVCAWCRWCLCWRDRN